MKKLVVLLVEDNKEDAFLVREALEEQSFVTNFFHVENGAEAIKFLKKEEPYQNVETPTIILMDLNMPIMDGHEALQKIKSVPKWKHIPIIILTTSTRKDDILKSYKKQSSSYIVKPDDIFQLDDIAETLKHYWTNTIQLP